MESDKITLTRVLEDNHGIIYHFSLATVERPYQNTKDVRMKEIPSTVTQSVKEKCWAKGICGSSKTLGSSSQQ